MPRKLEVTLDWDGPWEDPNSVPKRAGIYLVIAGSKNSEGNWDTSSYDLLDIGQSGDAGARLDMHDRKDCWSRKKSSSKTLLFKFAPMQSENYTEIDRRIVECCLRAHTKPPCGTECNQGYDREDSVVIKNKGRYAPLKEEYSCSRRT